MSPKGPCLTSSVPSLDFGRSEIIDIFLKMLECRPFLSLCHLITSKWALSCATDLCYDVITSTKAPSLPAPQTREGWGVVGNLEELASVMLTWRALLLRSTKTVTWAWGGRGEAVACRDPWSSPEPSSPLLKAVVSISLTDLLHCFIGLV